MTVSLRFGDSVLKSVSMTERQDERTIQEAAADPRVPYTEDWIRRLIKRGEIKAVRKGPARRGLYFVDMESLLDYIEKFGRKK